MTKKAEGYQVITTSNGHVTAEIKEASLIRTWKEPAYLAVEPNRDINVINTYGTGATTPRIKTM